MGRSAISARRPTATPDWTVGRRHRFVRGVPIPRVALPSIERTPDGRRLVVSRVVAADRDAVWELLCDTERWPAWGPSVSDVRSSARVIDAGTTGEVQVARGPWVPFEITACENYRWTWRVAMIPATGHRVENAPGGCRVVFEIPLAAAGYAVVCERALSRIGRLATGA
jgi:hypothetical protein